MNKISQTELNDLLFYLFIFALGLMSIAIILGVFEDAFAQTRDDVTELKQDRIILQQELNGIPDLIKQNESQQRELGFLRDRYQLDLQELEDNKNNSATWIEAVEAKEKQIEETKDEINVLKQEKIDILNSVNDIKIKINEIDKLLKDTIIDLRKNSKKAIGVALSNACLVEIQNPITNPNISKCPSYQDLYDLMLDTSDYDVTGSFGVEDDLFHRLGDSKLKNSWRWYDLNDYHIFIDPPANYYPSLKMIYIEQELDTFTDLQQLVKKEHVRTLSHDRFNDKLCKESVIGADNWLKILSDTIYFMRNNCEPQFTLVKTIEVIEDPYVEHDITTSQKWILENYQREVREKCLISYGECDVKNPWAQISS